MVLPMEPPTAQAPLRSPTALPNLLPLGGVSPPTRQMSSLSPVDEHLSPLLQTMPNEGGQESSNSSLAISHASEHL